MTDSKKSPSVMAAQYLRMSTDQQQYSTENQATAIQAYAASRSLDIVATYKDEGKSGLRLDGRRGLRDLLQIVESGTAPFRTIIVYDVSRWGRFQDADESAYYEYVCRRAGIAVEYCAEPFENNGSPLSTIIKGIKRAMAGEYSRELSTKVFDGQRRQVERGFILGGMAGYGLRRQVIDANGTPKVILAHGQRKNIREDRIILIPGPVEEIETIRWVCREYLAGATVKDIADDLRKRGVRTDTGKPFTVKTVNSILTCERYIGESVWNKSSQKLKGPRRVNREEEWVRYPNAYPALIDRATFDAVQAERIKRRTQPTDEELLKPLRTLLKQKGFLSIDLINQTAGLPTSTSYINRFGSMRRLYERVGYRPSNDYSYADINKLLRGLHPAIMDQIAAALRAANFEVEERAEGHLVVDTRHSLSVVMARYRRSRDLPLGWHCIEAKRVPTEFVLFARTDRANAKVVDYYLFPGEKFSELRSRLTVKAAPGLSEYLCADVGAATERLRQLITSREN